MADNDPGLGSAGKPAAVLADPVMMATAGATGKEKTAGRRKKTSKSKKKSRHRGSDKENRPPKHKRSRKGENRRRGRRRPDRDGGGHGRGSKTSSNVVAVPPAPPLFDEAPLTQRDNLAGYADTQARTVLGVANRSVKVALPSNQNRLTHESFVHFRVKSTNEEHVRFRPDSLSPWSSTPPT